MKFWDTSALVPLVVDEPSTPGMRALLQHDPDVIIWMFTSVELLSTLARLGRTSDGLADLLPGARQEVLQFLDRCATVMHVEGVRKRAERLVGVHPLAAADAMQLAAALVAAGDEPRALDFVTLDRNLARAAQLEGFRVVTA